MTTPVSQIACDDSVVKAQLVASFAQVVESLINAARQGTLTPREAERKTWKAIVQVGALLLAAIFTVLCQRATAVAVAEFGLGMVDVELRMGKDYWTTLKSTLGPIRFPWFAFRSVDGTTHVPAKALFPLRQRMRATEVLLEWECALAADHPFRKAAEALLFFSHGAVDIEDNTIERHAVLVGSTVPRAWLYRTVDEIRRVLVENATRDANTGRPILYASSDAHALRRFVDKSWVAAWKMSNGIRLWCIDKATGATVHLGGEYTWDDCEGVTNTFLALQQSGHLPADGDYGNGLVAQVTLVTDGVGWIASRIHPIYPGAVLILDLYHVVEHVADVARKLYPRSKTKARKLIAQARRKLGVRDRRPRAALRKGPRVKRPSHPPDPPSASGSDLLEFLIPLLQAADLPATGLRRLALALEYIADNTHRMDYADLRRRGFQIGSGAMESFHRTASQIRLKRPGCRWTPEAAQAILNLRLVQQCGRWDEYWAQPDLPERLVAREAA